MKFFNWKKKPEPKKTEIDINIFFKYFILSTLKELPAETDAKIKKLELDKVFSTNFSDWKMTIKKVLNLSSTIEIAIKDLWLRNHKIPDDNGDLVSPEHFADLFIHNYYAENSKVDVWQNESVLIDAQKRIAESHLA